MWVGFIRDKIRERIEKMRKELERPPMILVQKLSRCAGPIQELHEDGLVFASLHQEIVSMNPQTQEAHVARLPAWDKAKMAFHLWGTDEFVMVEEPQSIVQQVPTRLILPK